MKHVIIGTAGHVDHGKTTLIKALTGTNTDRLKEEQARGMTIDLGFASLRLPDGTLAGIVDVPGHERFLKNMLAGVSGVDVVLLVIAADESVMPQTVEHLDILRLLDVQNGVVALTKMDAVDKEWTDAVEEDVRARLAGTFLAESPIIRVSATTGKGIDALKRALMQAVSRAEARNASLPFRLPIDRVFTRPGFGTVVTGTLVAGRLRVGDNVEIAPHGLLSRVRGLQVHGEKVSEADAGTRVAVNLHGIETVEIERGAQVSAPGALPVTSVFDAVLHLLPDAEKILEDRARVRLHHGTSELLGRIRILSAEEGLEAGQKAYIQFRSEQPLACLRGDRFILRTYSPMVTIAGGVILDPLPLRHRKADEKALINLAARERGRPEDLIESCLLRSPYGVAKKDLLALTGLPATQAAEATINMIATETVILTPGDRLFAASILLSLTGRVCQTLTSYHQQFPLRPGMPKEELRTALSKDLDTRAYASLLSYWQSRQTVLTEGANVRIADFQVELNDRQNSLLERIAQTYVEYGIAIPTIQDVSRIVKAPPDALLALLRVGVERGLFARIADGQYFHHSTIEHLQRIITEHIAANKSITVGAFRDLTQTNRKFAMQALEYLDLIHFTRRQGDDRVLW